MTFLWVINESHERTDQLLSQWVEHMFMINEARMIWWCFALDALPGAYNPTKSPPRHGLPLTIFQIATTELLCRSLRI